MQFIGIHSVLNPSENDWPAMCAECSYWLEAAQYINKTCQTSHLQIGTVNFKQYVNTRIMLTCNEKSITGTDHE